MLYAPLVAITDCAHKIIRKYHQLKARRFITERMADMQAKYPCAKTTVGSGYPYSRSVAVSHPWAKKIEEEMKKVNIERVV